MIHTGGREAERTRIASFAVGAGASFVAGKGAGYSPALAERMVISLSFAEASALSIEIDHARHVLSDASGLYPDLDVPPDAVSGASDFLSIEWGGRLGLSLTERMPSDRVRAWPWLWAGVGCAFTATEIKIPAFSGSLPVRSRITAPLVSVGGGADVRLKPWLSLHPGLKVQFLFANDPGEVDHLEKWGATVRAQPAVDIAIDF